MWYRNRGLIPMKKAQSYVEMIGDINRQLKQKQNKEFVAKRMDLATNR